MGADDDMNPRKHEDLDRKFSAVPDLFKYYTKEKIDLDVLDEDDSFDELDDEDSTQDGSEKDVNRSMDETDDLPGFVSPIDSPIDDDPEILTVPPIEGAKTMRREATPAS